jgi:hypothetical protein
MPTPKIQSFDDLTRALQRFEQLFGAPESSPEASYCSEISHALRAFEDEVAAQMSAQRMAAKGVLRIFPASCPPAANLP